MIVWGGTDLSSYLNTGGVYDPATDTWTATSTTNAPTRRCAHTAVWTGSKMIVWGGDDVVGVTNTGGIYDPAANTWKAMSTTNAPTARYTHTAVWTGSKMIVWGGYGFGGRNTGGVYDPATNTWKATSTTNAPTARDMHIAVWTGSKMIVWGGEDDNGDCLNTGATYDHATNTWTATSTTGAPSARVWPTAAWTGSKMIVWGGADAGLSTFNTGGIYDPATDAWTATSTTGAPSGRWWATAIWTGLKMIVWGGLYTSGSSYVGLDTGGIYDPAADTWTATSTTNAPAGRDAQTAVWTGLKMIVWGGYDGSAYLLNTGGVYSNPDVLPPPLPPADFFTVTPCRLVDTRNAAGPTGGPALSPDATRSFTVTGGVCGIPSTAIAVSVNLTAVGAAAAGYLTLFASDGSMPLPGSIYFTPGMTRANNAIVLLARDGSGTISVYDGSTRAVHFVLDVNGYFQ
jgi:N-acetylneuraminic acid mutarotase